MRFRVFLKVLGTLLKLLGALMLVPAGISLIYGELEGVAAFIVPAFIALVIASWREFRPSEVSV